MEFVIEDTIKKINEGSETLKTLTKEESDAVDSRINDKMQEVARDFREKQNRSIEASSKVFLT